MSVVATLVKLVPLAVIVTAGLFLAEPRTLPLLNPTGGRPFVAFAAAFTIAFFSYLGIESATVPAEDVIDAPVTVPRVTIVGTLTVIGVYLLVLVVTMGIIPSTQLVVSASPLAAVGERIAGRLGTVAVSLGALVSIYTALHYTVLLGAQIPMVAAQDGLFPKPFRQLSRRGTPSLALLTTGLLISGLIVLNSSKGLVAAYTFINLMSTLTTVIPYAFCAQWRRLFFLLLHRNVAALVFVRASSRLSHSAPVSLRRQVPATKPSIHLGRGRIAGCLCAS